MTINSKIVVSDSLANGTDVNFSFSFFIFDTSEIKVITRSNDTVPVDSLVSSTDYTVTRNSNGTGTVIFTNAPTNGYRVFIIRDLPLTQEGSLSTSSQFLPENIEEYLDRGIMVSQQIQESLDRSIKAPVIESGGSFNAELPASIIGNSNRAIVTNDNGDGFNVGPTTTDIETVAGIADNIALINDDVVEDLDIVTTEDEGRTPLDDMKALAPEVSKISALGDSDVIEDMETLTADDNLTNIGIVSGINEKVGIVAGIEGSVKLFDDEVVTDMDMLTNLLPDNTPQLTNINTVADNIEDVNAVATNIIDINQVAADSNSAADSASSAAASAAAAEAINNLMVVNTLAQMRALPQQPNRTCIIVSELNGAGDGGGGIYQYNSTSTLTEVEGKIYAPTTTDVDGRYIDVQGTAPIDIRKLRGSTDSIHPEIDNSNYSDLTTWSTSSDGLGYGIQSWSSSITAPHKATCPIDIRSPGKTAGYAGGNIDNTHINLTYMPDDIDNAQIGDSAKIVFGAQNVNGSRVSSPNAWIRGGRTSVPTSGPGHDDGAVWIGTAATDPNGIQDRIMIDNLGSIVPVSTHSDDQNLGLGSERWDTIYLHNQPDVASDATLKEKIEDSELGLDFLNMLRPTQYEYKDKPEKTKIITKREQLFDEVTENITKKVTKYDKSMGRWVEEDVTETVTNKSPRTEIVDIYDKEGNVVRQERRPIFEDIQVFETKPSRTFTDTHYGLIAQEVEAVLNNLNIPLETFSPLVTNDGIKSIRYGEFTAILIKAVQELSQRVEALENGR